MQQNTWVQLMAMRGKDAQAIILPYVLSVLGVFTFIIWEAKPQIQVQCNWLLQRG